MSDISINDVKKLAALAALSVSNAEAVTLSKELQEILEYVKQLDAVDTTGLGPTYQVTGLKNVTRSDELINYGTNQADLLKNVPHISGGSIEVPKVL